jgi:hypothetical protein
MKFRRPLKITSRTSSITNSFVQAIIPTLKPTTAELEEALAVLDMALGNTSCVYCGVGATDWDHLRPLVKGKRPTGFLNEARNLVPCCGPCNQSKSGAYWKDWMEGQASGSPKTRGVVDVDDRIARLSKFEEWGNLTPFPIQDVVGPEKWEEYWNACQEIENKMKAAQLLADEIQKVVETQFTARKASVPTNAGNASFP